MMIVSLSQYAQSSLILASENGHEDVVRILLSAHARVNQQNEVISNQSCSITLYCYLKLCCMFTEHLFSPDHGGVFLI